jgi:hypothetical protein
MDNNMNISNLERLDTPTSWAWDFNYLGQKVWMVSERDEFGDSVEDKNGEMVSKPLWCTRILVGDQELQSHYGSRKWDAWENRVEHLRNVSDIVSEVTPVVEKAQKKVAKVKEQLSGLNDKEQLVLKEMFHNAMDCAGGDFGFTDEVVNEWHTLMMSKPEVKGYIGSLKKKDMVWIDTTDEGYQQFGLTDRGWKVVTDLNLVNK